LNLYKYEIEYKNDLLSLQNTGVWTQKKQKLYFNDSDHKYVTKPRKLLL